MKRPPFTPLEFQLVLQLKAAKLPMPIKEHHFHPTKAWRFDFAYPELRIALEVEGGVWKQGRHTRGGGYTEDCAKYNAAATLGWIVLRYPGGLLGNVAADLRACITLRTPNKVGGPINVPAL